MKEFEGRLKPQHNSDVSKAVEVSIPNNLVSLAEAIFPIVETDSLLTTTPIELDNGEIHSLQPKIRGGFKIHSEPDFRAGGKTIPGNIRRMRFK